jgi:hypothetical protein
VAASLTTVRVKVLTLVASVGATASVTKLPAKLLTGGATVTIILVKHVGKQGLAALGLTTGLSKLISKSISANPVFSAIVTAIKLGPGAASRSAIVASLRLGNQAIAATVRMGNQAVAATVWMNTQTIVTTMRLGNQAIEATMKLDIIKAIVGRLRLG